MFTEIVSNLEALLVTLRAQLITPDLLAYLPNIIIAMILGLFLGLERRRRHKSAGVRTMMVISGASALIAALGMIVTTKAGIGDPTRIAAQLLAGIGFIGAGVILKRGIATQGVTTASTILLAVGIGMSCGFGQYGLAVAITFVMVIALTITTGFFGSREQCNPIVVVCKAEHQDAILQLFGSKAQLTGFEKLTDGELIELHIEPELTARQYEALTHRLLENPHIIKVELEADAS